MRWAKFLAISSFVLLPISALIIIGVGFMVGQTDTYAQTSQTTGYTPAEYQWSYALVYLLIILVLLIPAYYLYKFSNSTLEALYEEDSTALTKAFRFLKNHYKYIAVITIAGLMFYTLAIIIVTANTNVYTFNG